MAKPTETTNQTIKNLSSQYLNHVKVNLSEQNTGISLYFKEIRESLSTQILQLNEDMPYQNSIYGAKKDAEIVQMKVDFIHNEIQSILEKMKTFQSDSQNENKMET